MRYPIKASVPVNQEAQLQGCYTEQEEDESMRQRIERVREDLGNIEQFYNIQLSDTRRFRLQKYLKEELVDLQSLSFNSYNQGGKIDYLLLQNYLKQRLRQLDLDAAKNKKTEPLLPFATKIIVVCEARQKMEPIDGKVAAEDVFKIGEQLVGVQKMIEEESITVDKTTAFRAAKMVDLLRSHLAEWFHFFKGYDPTFSWWVTQPFEKVDRGLSELASLIRERLVGINPGDTNQIIGDPVGNDGLMSALEAEVIPYTPEELIQIADTEYVWCEEQMKSASSDLGFGDDWRNALEHVKNLYVEPGKQPQLIRDLALEAINYVKEKDLVTVPPIAEETYRMFMMTPEAQKTNPFFLGGDSILVSYPTDTSKHLILLSVVDS